MNTPSWMSRAFATPLRSPNPTSEELLGALALKAREAQALRQDLFNPEPWDHELVITPEQIGQGLEIVTGASIDHDGNLRVRFK